MGCAGIKPDAALERTGKWKAQTKTGFCNYLVIIFVLLQGVIK